MRNQISVRIFFSLFDAKLHLSNYGPRIHMVRARARGARLIVRSFRRAECRARRTPARSIHLCDTNGVKSNGKFAITFVPDSTIFRTFFFAALRLFVLRGARTMQPKIKRSSGAALLVSTNFSAKNEVSCYSNRARLPGARRFRRLWVQSRPFAEFA